MGLTDGAGRAGECPWPTLGVHRVLNDIICRRGAGVKPSRSKGVEENMPPVFLVRHRAKA
jgi:hypothetical protein